jgi:hypothetical protein
MKVAIYARVSTKDKGQSSCLTCAPTLKCAVTLYIRSTLRRNRAAQPIAPSPSSSLPMPTSASLAGAVAAGGPAQYEFDGVGHELVSL